MKTTYLTLGDIPLYTSSPWEVFQSSQTPSQHQRITARPTQFQQGRILREPRPVFHNPDQQTSQSLLTPYHSRVCACP